MWLHFSYSGNASLNPYSFCFSLYYLHHIHSHSFQTPIDLSSSFFIHKISLYSSPALRFSHFSFHVNSFLKLRLKTDSAECVLCSSSKIKPIKHAMSCLFSLPEKCIPCETTFFSCVTFCPVLYSSNVTKTSSGWPVTSDLLADIWHQCSLNVWNQKICQIALAWAVQRLLWWK